MFSFGDSSFYACYTAADCRKVCLSGTVKIDLNGDKKSVYC